MRTSVFAVALASLAVAACSSSGAGSVSNARSSTPARRTVASTPVVARPVVASKGAPVATRTACPAACGPAVTRAVLVASPASAAKPVSAPAVVRFDAPGGASSIGGAHAPASPTAKVPALDLEGECESCVGGSCRMPGR